MADYTREILKRIERHKQYPAAARRRRLAGSVTLNLHLAADGRIAALRCLKGPRLLCRAAERATRAAAPFPPLPAGMAPPVLDYRMRFRLY